MEHLPFGGPTALLASATVLLAACTTTPVPRSTGPVPLALGSAEGFTAVVSPSTAEPRCAERPDAPVPTGGRAVAFIYSASPERQITVTLDAAGVPVRYIDVRGDLSESDDRVGDRTTIGLYLTEGYAVLSNRPDSSQPTIVEVPLADALGSEALGRPDAMLDRVLTACAQAR